MDGATNLCSPSTLLKVNYQVMRYLYFVSVEGDLQEGHFTLPNANSPSARAQKPRFCARKARKWGFQRQKAHKNLDFVLGKPENLTSGLVLVLLLMLIIDNLDVAIFCIDWIYNNYYFILHCQR